MIFLFFVVVSKLTLYVRNSLVFYWLVQENDLWSKCSFLQTYTHIHVCVIINGSSCCSPSVSPNSEALYRSLEFSCFSIMCFCFHSPLVFIIGWLQIFRLFRNWILWYFVLWKIEYVYIGFMPLHHSVYRHFSFSCFGFLQFFVTFSIWLVFGILKPKFYFHWFEYSLSFFFVQFKIVWR